MSDEERLEASSASPATVASCSETTPISPSDAASSAASGGSSEACPLADPPKDSIAGPSVADGQDDTSDEGTRERGGELRACEEEGEEPRPARGEDPRPYIVLTAVVDSGARVAAMTLSHADAWERAQRAIGARSIAGLDLVELPISPRAFAAVREKMKQPADAVAFYDIFPLAAHLGRTARKVAGQFLAAEVLWTLEEQGILEGVPLNVRLDVPRSWGDRSPKGVHQRLLDEGALDLSDSGIEDFRAIKQAWDGG